MNPAELNHWVMESNRWDRHFRGYDILPNELNMLWNDNAVSQLVLANFSGKLLVDSQTPAQPAGSPFHHASVQ